MNSYPFIFLKVLPPFSLAGLEWIDSVKSVKAELVWRKATYIMLEVNV